MQWKHNYVMATEISDFRELHFLHLLRVFTYNGQGSKAVINDRICQVLVYEMEFYKINYKFWLQ
jgi:hypothetical protein